LFGRGSLEILLGDGGPRLFDPHAVSALKSRLGPHPTTARFYLADQERYLQAMLDYILVSEDLRGHSPKWRIWHPFDDPVCWQTPELREALLTASDHFPVSVDIDI
nr:endonuclease [Paracoccaceae bacterium]